MTQSDDDTFARATSAVADFDSPFYAEERQRDVWNEASAIGFQTMLWGGVALACAMTWIGGRPQLGWTAALLCLIALASGLSIAHAKRLGVSGREDARLNRPRTYLFGVLYAATIIGVVVRSDTDLSGSTLAGAAVGGAAVIAVAALVRRWARTGD